MKCPECSKNHKYRDGMLCSCGYVFVLDPKKDGMSDAAFIGAMRSAAGDGTGYYTRHGLWRVIAEKKPGCGTLVGCSFITFFVLVASLALSFPWSVQVGILVVSFAMYHLVRRQEENNRPSQAKVDGYIKRWQEAKRHMPNFIDKPSLTPPPAGQEADIFAYGAERILVVDDPILVDYFVLNGLHEDERAAVISVTGYPQHLIEPIRKLGQERPDIPVFLLHAATPEGEAMASKLPDWLPTENVTDLGLKIKDVATNDRLKKLHALDPSTPLRPDTLSSAAIAGLVGVAFLSGITLAQAATQQNANTAGDAGGNFG